jgi:hypothetical protein
VLLLKHHIPKSRKLIFSGSSPFLSAFQFQGRDICRFNLTLHKGVEAG